MRVVLCNKETCTPSGTIVFPDQEWHALVSSGGTWSRRVASVKPREPEVIGFVDTFPGLENIKVEYRDVFAEVEIVLLEDGALNLLMITDPLLTEIDARIDRGEVVTSRELSEYTNNVLTLLVRDFSPKRPKQSNPFNRFAPQYRSVADI